MSEDVAAYLRLAVTIVLLAALVSATIVLLYSALSTSDALHKRVLYSMEGASSAIVTDVVNAKWVSAAEAYKFINSNGYSIGSVRINYSDGTTETDLMSLLRHAEKNVKVTVTQTSGVANYVLTEVK